MIVCIDTNVVLSLFTLSHAHHLILRRWQRGLFTWAVSTDILLEYDEVMLRQGSPRKAAMMEQIMSLGRDLHENLLHVSPTYRFRTITADADDDKFADCAISADADFIITEDHHFDVLIGSGYKPQPITPEAFIARFLSAKGS